MTWKGKQHAITHILENCRVQCTAYFLPPDPAAPQDGERIGEAKPAAHCWAWNFFLDVLGSARTGLIFTMRQEWTQPGGLTQPGQTEQGIPYHVPPCRVRGRGGSGAELGGRKAVAAREHQAMRVALCISLFVLYILLICIVAVTVHFVCCSVKLPSSRPTRVFSAFFFPFSSPPQWEEGQQSDRVALCCQPRAKT